MDCTVVLTVIVFAASIVKCDWVEIPAISLDKEKEMQKPDITSYIITTTSTTVQTPVFAKPVVTNKSLISNYSKSLSANSPNKPTATNSSNVAYVLSQSNNKTNISVKNIANEPHNITKNYTNYKNNTDAEEIYDEYFYDENNDSQELHIEQRKDEEFGYSYTTFIPYMSAIQSTLMKNAHKNKKSKINVLKNLRDHLLSDIENRMSSLWNIKTKSRGAREYKDDSHVDFPSNEGALMTIGFLTFAVFLIKLVLQLIQTIGNKMDNNGDTTTTTIIGRKRRSVLDDEAIKILNYIEQYRLK